MVLGITTVPAPLVATSKLEITDPRAAKIKEIVTLPIKGIRAVESDGQIVFISDNGRFVITGQIYDVWGKKPSARCRKCVMSPTVCISRYGNGC